MGRCENVFGEVPCIERVHYTRDSGRIKGVKPPTYLNMFKLARKYFMVFGKTFMVLIAIVRY